MPLKFITIPIRDSVGGETDLNAFLASHRILAVERRFVDVGADSFWAVCVDYLAGPVQAAGPQSAKKARVDYRELLPAEDFAVFVALRDLRKQLAQREAVPVYTIFTNEQLGEMARRRVDSRPALEAIVGVGDARVAKYGDLFLAAVGTAGVGREAGGPPAGGDRGVGQPAARGGPGAAG